MSFRKTFLSICCLMLAACGIYLLTSLPGSIGTSVGGHGGAAQFTGKHDIKDSPYFAHPDIYNLKNTGNLLILEHFPTLQQTTGYTCGPAAANMVVKYFLGKTLHSELEVAEAMSSSPTAGTDTRGMTAYFKKLGWTVESSADSETPDSYAAFLQFVRKNLSANTPIIVENIDWGGHWRVIIGYDSMGTEHTGDDVLLMGDPFDTSDHLQDGYNIVPAERFFYMWFDHQLYPKKDQLRQWLTAKPK